ncbi:Neuronal acetylcholine receptor subunit alpha-10 [Lamellibrachia satsuma]|nr:Neuronal acetylcholine receptor subunit alpha-10 [Lamellibrachia satsuma]
MSRSRNHQSRSEIEDVKSLCARRRTMQWSCAQTCAAVAFTALLSLTEVSSAATSYHKEILDKILGGNYTSIMRPVLDDTHTIQVSMRMTLYQIRDMLWHDDFLTWDPSSHGNVATIHVPSSMIWRPDISLYNSVDEDRPSTELLSDTAAVVSSTGDIKWSIPVVIKSACRVNVADYPFDIQRCPLKFGSWNYRGFELNLTNFADTAILDDFESNGEWHLEGVPCERHEVVYGGSQDIFPDVTFTVVMKRRPMFYLFHLLFPCVLLTAIGLMTFCLPPESGEKVSLAVTVLLAMTVFMRVIMENIPPTSEVIPLFEQFFGATISVLTMTTVANVLVMNAHFRGLRGHRPPAWVRKLFPPMARQNRLHAPGDVFTHCSTFTDI